MARITVSESDIGRTISPDLWGVFFEDINSAADGGLYAELVRNRSFDFDERDGPGWHALTGWSTSGSATASIGVHRTAGHSRNHVAITGGPGDGMLNDGFDGIVVADGAHPFRLIASGDRLLLQIEEGDDVLASSVLDPQASDQVLLEGRLIPSRPSACARLAVRLADGGSAEVSFVSLFPPETFGGSDNGLRRDLAETIADLRPRFMRFPGGCVTHGLGLDNVYRWTRTLGPVEDRLGMFNLWGFHQSLGLGYYEYFRFCEQIGAKPLPVVAAGVCCQNLPGGALPIPDDEMDAYVQEVLDLIEFANGSVNSEWGSVRAAAGHPEPFGLEYLGLGNEDTQTGTFRDRFRRIWDAVTAAHPEITVIGTVGPNPFGIDWNAGWAFASDLGVAIVDEHSYKSPRWLFENLGRYDSYDREAPAVYVGEYGSKGNSLLNALAEAAYMSALERNGDVVRLASYAPLLAKVDRTQWVPDLIYFDNERVMPTLNYHVQRMHARARGNTAIPVAVEGAPGFVRPRPGAAAIEFMVEDGSGVFRDVTLDGSGSMLLRSEGAPVAFGLQTDADEYIIRGTARLESGDKGFVVRFGELESPDYFEWRLGAYGNRYNTLFMQSDGFPDELTDQLPFRVTTGTDYAIEIRVEGRDRRIRCLLDGGLIHDWRGHGNEERFSATAVGDASTSTVYVKIVNATGVPTQMDLALPAGVTPVEVTLLAGDDPAAGVPFETAPAEPTVSPWSDDTKIPGHAFAIVRCAVADPAKPTHSKEIS